MKPKLIQRAMFASGGLHQLGADPHTRPDSVIRGAVIQVGGINFESARPTSAGNAEFINRVCEEACK